MADKATQTDLLGSSIEEADEVRHKWAICNIKNGVALDKLQDKIYSLYGLMLVKHTNFFYSRVASSSPTISDDPKAADLIRATDDALQRSSFSLEIDR